jgi:hypothetical protein
MSLKIKEYDLKSMGNGKKYILYKSTDKRETDFLGNYFITFYNEKIFRGKFNTIEDADKSIFSDLQNNLELILSDTKQFNNLKLNLEIPK